MPEPSADSSLERSTNNWMTAGLVLMVALILAFVFARLSEPAERDDAREALVSGLVEQGRVLYVLNCAACHGVDGEGGTASALNSRQFLFSTVDEQIRSIVGAGIPGSEMVAYSIDFGGPLTSQQVDAVTAYLRSLEPDAPDRPDWRDLGD